MGVFSSAPLLFQQDEPKDCHVWYKDHTTPHGATTYYIISEDEYKEKDNTDYTTKCPEQCNNEWQKEYKDQCN